MLQYFISKLIIIFQEKEKTDYYLCLVRSMWVRSGQPIMTRRSKSFDPTQPTTGAGP